MRVQVCAAVAVGLLVSGFVAAQDLRDGPGPGEVSMSPAQREVTGTTVITHGYQTGGSVPDWSFVVADAIRLRAGGGRVLEYIPTTGELQICSHWACGPQAEDGETIIVFDWANDSNDSGEGFSESAAEALAAVLVRSSASDPPLVNLEHLHLIGHSRGAVVNSEAAERLIAAGFPAPEHVTNLDPHDSGALRAPGEDPEKQLSWEDLEVNEEHPEYVCSDPPGEASGVCSWAGVGFNDNFWRDIDNLVCFLDPDGKVVPGSADLDASGLDDLCHSDVHRWYYFTIDTAAATHPVSGNPPGADWFEPANTSCATSSRTWPLARTVDGFNFSRMAGAAMRCPDEPARRQAVHFDFNLREGLVNGAFDKEGSGGADIPGWSFHGGGGTAAVSTLGDNFLDLYAGQWRTRNRLLLPRFTTGVRFCRRVFDPGSGESFSVRLLGDGGDRVLYEETLTAVTDWECTVVPVWEDERQTVARLRLELGDLGSGSSANVGVDDVRLELGQTTNWSGQAP